MRRHVSVPERQTEGQSHTQKETKRDRDRCTEKRGEEQRKTHRKRETQRRTENDRHRSRGRAAQRAHGTQGQTPVQAERLPELHRDLETLPESRGGTEGPIVEPGGVCRESQEGGMAASCP